MDQASEALASRNDFLKLDSTSLANRNQDVKFGNGRGNKLAASALIFFSLLFPVNFVLIHLNPSFSFFYSTSPSTCVCVCVL
jgi:hypothetical protein